MKLFQSFLDERQRSFVSPKATPYSAQNNTGKDQREYELLKQIWFEESKASDDSWGLISWKFQHKSLISVDEFIDFSTEKLKSGFDCAFINPMIGNEALYYNVWEQGIDGGHTGLDKIFTFLSKSIGPQVTGPMGLDNFALCNYFVATPRFWNAYFNFVDGAVSLLETEVLRRSEVGVAFSSNANYGRDPLVTMRPFVIERLFSSFLAQNTAINCAPFPYQDAHYRLKFGDQLGNFLWSLSKLKNSAFKGQDKEKLQYWNHVRGNIVRSGLKTVVWQLDDPSPFFLSRECTEFVKITSLC
jgi:hypothetical protein